MRNEAPEVSPKQVYEWVKTGHWSLGQFSDWCNTQSENVVRSCSNILSQNGEFISAHQIETNLE